MPLADNIIRPTVTIADLPAGTTVILRTWDEQLDSRPANCTVEAPTLTPSEAAALVGKKITITRDDLYQFTGYIRRPQRMANNSDAGTRLLATDIREDIAGTILGQYGIGEVGGDTGGFRNAGFTIHFNPDGRPNRSAVALGVTGDVRYEGVYSFTGPGQGQYWTWGDAITFILNWYVSDELMTLQPDLIAHPAFSERAIMGEMTYIDAATALTGILGEIRAHWIPSYAHTLTSVPVFLPIHSDIDDNLITVPIEDPLQISPRTYNPYTPVLWDIDTNISRAYDRVEVHAGPDIIETFWTDADPATLAPADLFAVLTRTAGTENSFAWSYTIDMPQLAIIFEDYWGSGFAGSESPPTWLRHLVSRNTTGGYYSASADRLRPGDNVYIRPADTDTWRRVKSGFRIDYENRAIHLESKLSIHPTTAHGSAVNYSTRAGTFDLGITLAVHAPTPCIALTEEANQYLPARRTKIIRLPRLHRELRRASYIHTTGDLPRDGSRIASSWDIETTVDITTELEARRDYYWAAHRRAGCSIKLGFPAWPDIHIGNTIQFSGYDIGLTDDDGPFRVETLAINAETLATTVTATNELFKT